MLAPPKPARKYRRSSRRIPLAQQALELWREHEARASLATGAYDALALMRAAGLEPDPWQVRVATTPGDQLLLCHRQAGKSTIVAAIGLATALAKAGALVLLISRSLRQSMELYRKVRQFYNLTHPIGLTKDTETGLELVNGSRILCLPASEETIVGFSAVDLLVLDEAARIPDGTYYAVRPMLAMSQGAILALSSPFGRRGFFYEAMEETQAETHALDLPTVERLLADLHFPVDELSEPGLVAERDERTYAWTRTVLPATHNQRLSRRFLAHERRSIPALWFEQEYLVKFVDLGNVVFRYEDLMGMASQRQPFFDQDGAFQEDDTVVGSQPGFALGNGDVWSH